MVKIVTIQFGRLVKRLAEREITLTWDDEVIIRLAEEGYDPFFGARPLKRLIQQKIVNMLSFAILKGEIQSNEHIELYPKGTEILFRKVKQ